MGFEQIENLKSYTGTENTEKKQNRIAIIPMKAIFPSYLKTRLELAICGKQNCFLIFNQ